MKKMILMTVVLLMMNTTFANLTSNPMQDSQAEMQDGDTQSIELFPDKIYYSAKDQRQSIEENIVTAKLKLNFKTMKGSVDVETRYSSPSCGNLNKLGLLGNVIKNQDSFYGDWDITDFSFNGVLQELTTAEIKRRKYNTNNGEKIFDLYRKKDFYNSVKNATVFLLKNGEIYLITTGGDFVNKSSAECVNRD